MNQESDSRTEAMRIVSNYHIFVPNVSSESLIFKMNNDHIKDYQMTNILRY